MSALPIFEKGRVWLRLFWKFLIIIPNFYFGFISLQLKDMIALEKLFKKRLEDNLLCRNNSVVIIARLCF